jgi:hypothetical protein
MVVFTLIAQRQPFADLASVDVYFAGMVVFTLIEQRQPFADLAHGEVVRRLRDGARPPLAHAVDMCRAQNAADRRQAALRALRECDVLAGASYDEFRAYVERRAPPRAGARPGRERALQVHAGVRARAAVA